MIPNPVEEAVTRAGEKYFLSAKEILLPRAGGKRLPPHREPSQVAARVMVAQELRQLGWSWPKIARALGYREHTGILKLIHKLQKGGTGNGGWK